MMASLELSTWPLNVTVLKDNTHLHITRLICIFKIISDHVMYLYCILVSIVDSGNTSNFSPATIKKER